MCAVSFEYLKDRYGINQAHYRKTKLQIYAINSEHVGSGVEGAREINVFHEKHKKRKHLLDMKSTWRILFPLTQSTT